MIEAKRIQFMIVCRELQEALGTTFIQKVHERREMSFIPALIYSIKIDENCVRLSKELGINVLKVPLEKDVVWPVIEDICKREEAVEPFECYQRDFESRLPVFANVDFPNEYHMLIRKRLRKMSEFSTALSRWLMRKFWQSIQVVMA